MPNWCHTSAILHGTEEEILAFVDGINDKGGKYSILQSYYPCPPELNIVSGFLSEDHDGYAEWKQAQESNLAKHGFTDWYEWCNEKWGTKWGDCDLEVHSFTKGDDGTAFVSLHFQTAWSPAEAGFLHISKMFPSIRWEFQYDEEAGFYCGIVVMKNGEMLYEGLFSPAEDYKDELDFDDDESVEKYENWRNERLGELEAQANGVGV